MDTEKTSLRSLVEKWLPTTPIKPLRVASFGRTGRGVRFVSIEVPRLAGTLSVAFFYHDDGVWRVFPPGPTRLEMTNIYAPAETLS